MTSEHEHAEKKRADDEERSSKDLLYAILSAESCSEFQCGKCLNVYKNDTTLTLHMKLKHPLESERARCAICDKEYSSQLSLQKHVHYLHRFEHRCPACYRGFVTRELLAAHGATSCRAGGGAHMCRGCGKLFGTRLALANHDKYMHPGGGGGGGGDGGASHRCARCGRAFVSERGLRNHLNAIHPGEHTCAICKATFPSAVELKAHDAEAHAAGTVPGCSLCYKRFRSLRRHERHMREYHGPHAPPHACALCGKALRTAVSLENHKRVVHYATANGDHVVDLTA